MVFLLLLQQLAFVCRCCSQGSVSLSLYYTECSKEMNNQSNVSQRLHWLVVVCATVSMAFQKLLKMETHLNAKLCSSHNWGKKQCRQRSTMSCKKVFLKNFQKMKWTIQPQYFSQMENRGLYHRYDCKTQVLINRLGTFLTFAYDHYSS